MSYRRTMVSARGISRPLQDLNAEAARALSAQLGVYEIVDDAGATVFIGQAGGLETFGLRSALEREAEASRGVRFRYEFTHAYRTRWQELLMLHHAIHGDVPVNNRDDTHLLGRLS